MATKLWCIGDCFTWGFGTEESHPYFKFKSNDDKPWTRLVASHFNLKLSIPDNSGGATPYTVYTFLSLLQKFNRGDIVIISDSVPEGILSIARNKKRIRCIASMDIENFNAWSSSEEKEAVVKYVDNQITPFLSQWEQFYREEILNIANEIGRRGVNVLFWSYRLWKYENRFETIAQATNGSIDDPHFSWKGHHQFAQYIIDRINNRDFDNKSLI